MAKSMGSGWHLESHRHSLASKGIKTGHYNPAEYVRPFNERGKLEFITDSKIYDLHKKALSGQELTREEKDYIFQQIRGNSFFKKGVALQGMRLDFTPVLKRFFVKYDYGDVTEIYALDKTNIRNSYYTNRGIAEIIELPKKED